MDWLARERETLAELLPGLDERVRDEPLVALESADSPGIKHFRAAGGPGLLVPREQGGVGASPVEAVRVQRAVGSRSPSLAVGTTMHHFSVASLRGLTEQSNGPEALLLQAIAEQGLLLASGFAEGKTGQHILEPTMTATATDGGLEVSGAKRPCSLSQSMDLLTASVRVSEPAGGSYPAVALIPADAEGLTREPFWGNTALAGAESDAVIADRVHVPADLVVPLSDDALTDSGFLWFELLMTASYLGAASGLVERVLASPGIPAAQRSEVAIPLEAAMLSVESVAHSVAAGDFTETALASALIARYAAQDTIRWVSGRTVELLGGMAYVTSDETSLLASSTAALAFHPPSRASMADALVDYLNGAPLRVA